MVDLGVIRVARGVERAVEPVLGKLSLADLGRARSEQAADADVLGETLRVGIVRKAADGDAVRGRPVAADAVDRDAERLAEGIQPRGEQRELTLRLACTRIRHEAGAL